MTEKIKSEENKKIKPARTTVYLNPRIYKRFKMIKEMDDDVDSLNSFVNKKLQEYVKDKRNLLEDL